MAKKGKKIERYEADIFGDGSYPVSFRLMPQQMGFIDLIRNAAQRHRRNTVSRTDACKILLSLAALQYHEITEAEFKDEVIACLNPEVLPEDHVKLKQRQKKPSSRVASPPG